MKYIVIELPVDSGQLALHLNKITNLELVQVIPASRFIGQRIVNSPPKVESYLIGIFRIIDKTKDFSS